MITMWTVDRDGHPISLHPTQAEAEDAAQPGDVVTERTGEPERLAVDFPNP